jgi:hypothetical protein
MAGSVAVLAHQGGWDEMLMVLVPIALFAGLLALANRRAARQLAERDKTSGDDPGRAS